MNLKRKNYFVDDRIVKISEVKWFGQGLTASEWWGLELMTSSIRLPHNNTPLYTSQNTIFAQVKNSIKEKSLT